MFGKMCAMTVGAVALAATAVSLAPQRAEALAFGASCVTDVTAAAGAGDYTSPCGATGIISNTLTALGGARANAANWSVMSGDYGVFTSSLSGNEPNDAVFRSLSAGNTHRFGWSDTSGGTLTDIFSNTQAASIGDTAQFAPTVSEFLFFAENTAGTQSPNLFFTDRELNSFAGVEEFQQFVILEGQFDGRNEFLFFIEDLVDNGLASAPNSDYDYNDAVVLVQFSAVPEPATMAILAGALMGLGVARRRFIRR